MSTPYFIFLGTSDFAVPALEALVRSGFKIAAVITAPDKPIGRKQILTPPPVKIAAQKLGLKIFQPQKLEIRNWKLEIPRANIGVMAAYGKIIPEEIINLFPLGLINIHPSLLPQYRGPSPVQSAILNGEKETGITLILTDKEVDHGPMLVNSKFRIPNSELGFKELSGKLAGIGADLLVKTLPDYLEGKIKPQPQDHRQATFTRKFERPDGKINWHQPAEKIHRQILALNPNPGTWTTWQDKILNIAAGDVFCPVSCFKKQDQWSAGMVIKIENNAIVATVRCGLAIKFLQMEGKKETDFSSFLNGHPDFIGSRLG